MKTIFSDNPSYENYLINMDAIKLNEEFGDLFAYNLSVNFQNIVTEIYYGEYITENAPPIKKMIFENVVWQEFSEFDFVTIFNVIEIENSFEVHFCIQY